MIRAVKVGKEILVTVGNKIGVLADICKILADHGINLEAVAGYGQGNEAKLMLVASDALRAQDALRAKGYKDTAENNVVEVELENKTGALKAVSSKLSEAGVDIRYIYGSTCSGSCAARLIINTADNDKALLALRR